jgi:hypothetical protein
VLPQAARLHAARATVEVEQPLQILGIGGLSEAMWAG